MYIINVSYILEVQESYNDISIWQYISFFNTLISLLFTPYLNLLTITQYQQFQYWGFILTTRDKWCLIFLPIILLFSPITLIEIIHFFPILFSYYIDNNINYSQFVTIMILFNLTKVIFTIHMLKLYCQYNLGDPQKDAQFHLLMFIIIIVLSITLPLSPYIFIMLYVYADNTNSMSANKNFNAYDNNKNNCFKIFNSMFCCNKRTNLRNRLYFFGELWCYYWIIIAYLWISYIGSFICMLFYINWDLNVLSYPVYITLIIVTVCVIFVTFSFPQLSYELCKAKVTGIPLDLNLTLKCQCKNVCC